VATKEKKLIYETLLNIKKIIYNGDKVVYIDENQEKYSLNILVE
jgi:hypothetical protein